MNESVINKWFRIVTEDPSFEHKWPELKAGAEFMVLGVEADDGYNTAVGITRILLNGEVLDIHSRDCGYWCFWESNSLNEIEEILPQLKSDIAGRLYKCAGQENCDSEEYDLMQEVADYITKLEKQLGIN